MTSWAATAIGTSVLCTLLTACSVGNTQCEQLNNKFFKIDLNGSSITRMQVDPSGREAKSISFARGLTPECWEPSVETRTVVSGQKASISALRVWQYQPIEVTGSTDQPDRLEPGHTLAQSFAIPAGSTFSTVSVRLPTWNSKKSGATLSLYRGNELISSRQMKNVADNSWQVITVAKPFGEGSYRIEISEPAGTIGWWSGPEAKYTGGDALADGKTVPGCRSIKIDSYRTAGTGDLELILEGDTLRARAAVHPAAGVSFATLPWRWKTTWTSDGYDCTPQSGTLFSRFFTDNQRYIPIQQFKRRKGNGGVPINGAKWIEMDGTRDADLVLRSGNLHLHWELSPQEMSMRFDTPISQDGDTFTSEWSLTVKKHDDSIPAEFPHFYCSDPAMQRDLNRFLWDRAFSYPSPASGVAPWFEWMALIRSWFSGPAHDGEMKLLLDYPMTDEGYVHTWGSTMGWPLVKNRDTRHFDTNARFILACWRHYLWTGDKEFLSKQADRLRKAMKYQLEVLHGNDGLIATPEIKTGKHADLSNNYWDILPFGHLDAYANTVFYGSLTAMEQLTKIESGLRNAELDVDYAALKEKAHKRYDEVFWDEKAGRYIGCVDIEGGRHDYGFTFVNLEALYYGLGNDQKAKRIYRWMEYDPTSSGKPDTYSKWVFAPRTTTIHNPMWRDDAPADERKSQTKPWWTYWWGGTRYGAQCQDGGAILYTSFFDLMDRAQYRGADNAWQRFSEIIDRYRLPDRLCGGSPLYLGEKAQQEEAASVGVDMPFPESGLVPCYFLYGVIGVDAAPEGLRITPNLPSALEYAEVRNISWQGMSLGIRVTKGGILVQGTDKDGKAFKKTFPIKEGGSALLVLR